MGTGSTPPAGPLTELILAKINQQIDLLIGLIRRLPAEGCGMTPPLPPDSFPSPKSLGEVLGHLLQCLAGFVAVLHAVHPERLGHLLDLKAKPVNHACESDEAIERIEDYRRHIESGFAVLEDDELARVLPTVFAPRGEAVLSLLLGNFEHLVNHKHELFFYAKLLGVRLTSKDLYLFREPVRAGNGQVVAGDQHQPGDETRL
jgi:hypothetical protein